MIHGTRRAARCCVKFDIKNLLCYSCFVFFFFLVSKPKGEEYAMYNFVLWRDGGLNEKVFTTVFELI